MLEEAKKANRKSKEPKEDNTSFWDVKFKDDYGTNHKWENLSEDKRIDWILEQIDLMKYRMLVFEKAIKCIKLESKPLEEKVTDESTN